MLLSCKFLTHGLQGFVHQSSRLSNLSNWNKKLEDHHGGDRFCDYCRLHCLLFHCGQGSSDN